MALGLLKHKLGHSGRGIGQHGAGGAGGRGPVELGEMHTQEVGKEAVHWLGLHLLGALWWVVLRR